MKIAMLIVENRDYILTQYMKFMMGQVSNPNIHVFQFWYGQRKPIWYMRRKMIEQALLHKEVTHVCFIDTDVIPPKDYLDKLINHNKDVVSGIYYDTAGKPCSRKDGDYFKGEGLEEVDTFSMGLSLISREVLEKVEYPEPEPRNKIDGDKEFCDKIKEAGYKIYQDFTLRGAHFLTGIF